jgi:large subunit ribosomal protein L30
MPTRDDNTSKKLVVTYTKSAIGYNMGQKRTIAALGLRTLGQSIEHPDNPAIRGMIARVRHLVTVHEL